MENSKKKLSQRQHAKQRAWQRYGVRLSTIELKVMADLIQAGRSAHVKNINNRLSVHLVQARGMTMVAVYDRRAQAVATFLPAPCVPRGAVV